jgi:hypothetical protein
LAGVSRHGRAFAVCRPPLEGEKMAPLCAEFGISRKTGYKILNAIRTAASPRLRTEVGGRIARRIDCRRNWKR